MSRPLLQLRHVHVTPEGADAASQGHFRTGRVALYDVSLQLQEGDSLGVIGDLGAGKCTLLNTLAGMYELQSGELLLAGQPLSGQHRLYGLPRMRQNALLQCVIGRGSSQYFNPRYSVSDVLQETLREHCRGLLQWQRASLIDEGMALVGLRAQCLSQSVNTLGAWSSRRLALLRAAMIAPKLLACDLVWREDSSYNLSQELMLLSRLRERFGCALVLMARDFRAVAALCDQVAVMYAGRVVEQGTTAQVMTSPAHAYTAHLLKSRRPRLDGRYLPEHSGRAPMMLPMQKGCAYRPFCYGEQRRCQEQRPVLKPLRAEQQVACHFPLAAPSDSADKSA